MSPFFRTVCCCACLISVPAHAGVSYAGLDEAQEANVRALMPLAEASCELATWRVERLFRDSERHLSQALQALGYYEPDIAASLSLDGECWQAHFEVTPGPPVRWREIDVNITGEAAADPAVNELSGAGRPTPGGILHHGEYGNYKSRLLSGVLARGYFDAQFVRSEVRVDRGAQAADLALQLESGSRYHFGEVHFTTGIIDERILRNFSDINSGEPYSAEVVNELLMALNGSGYFESVSIATEPLDATNKTVPVNVTLSPGPRRIYSAGLGYATDTGPQARLDFANRRVNSRGHQIESRLYGSEVRSQFTASYRWPKRDPRKEWFSVVAGLQREETDAEKSDTAKLGFRRSMKRGRSWLETRYLEYASEDFTIGEQSSSSELIIVGSNWEYTRGREISRTLNGQRYNIDIGGASDALVSDTSFLQLKTSGKWIHSFDVNTRMLARARIGLTMKEDLEQLPASVRFFAGGDNSVRGYDYKTLAPRDEQGNFIGGSHLLELSLEIERLVRPQWAVAVFLDSGSAFNGRHPDLSTGVGIGLRWFSPVGPVRLDFAHPLDAADQSIRIHISLGLDL